MTQHLRLYCPKREAQDIPAPRGGRKILRPPPPAAAAALLPPPPPGGAEGSPKAVPNVKPVAMPYLHVRWQHKPVPHIPRNASSIPAAKGAPKAGPRDKRMSNAPAPPPILMGCWGRCTACNGCKHCRARTCNGACGMCSRCKTCREWGERLSAEDPEAIRAQEETIGLPEMEKRTVTRDPGNKAKLSATADRPKTAPPGSRKCPYCDKWLMSYHQENCPDMPYEIWREATKQRLIIKHGQATVDSWNVQCQHCAQPFPSGASKRVHLTGCERRRAVAGLPLNQHPATR